MILSQGSFDQMTPAFCDHRTYQTATAEHNALCLEFPEERCITCRIFFGTTHHSDVANWLRHNERERHAGRIGDLPDHFCQLIATAMVRRPDLFAPIIQFLNSYQGAQQ